jgi:hypothetical protein
MSNISKGGLTVEALRFALAVFEAAIAGEEEAMNVVWKDYSREEQFAIATSLAGLDEGLSFIKTFVLLQLIVTPELHSMSMSNRRAAEILATKRERSFEHAKN